MVQPSPSVMSGTDGIGNGVSADAKAPTRTNIDPAGSVMAGYLPLSSQSMGLWYLAYEDTSGLATNTRSLAHEWHRTFNSGRGPAAS
jgi:hypothetical protein